MSGSLASQQTISHSVIIVKHQAIEHEVDPLRMLDQRNVSQSFDLTGKSLGFYYLKPSKSTLSLHNPLTPQFQNYLALNIS